MLTPYLRKADTTNMLLPYFRDADTTSLNLTNRFNTKLNISDTTLMLSKYLRKLDTITLSNRINLKVNISDTASMLTPYFRDTDTTSLNLTSRFNTKINLSDTLNMLTPYLRKADTTNMLLPYFRDADTTSLNLTNRFNTKLNISDTTSMLLPYLRKADTTNMLLPYFRDADTTSLNLTSRFNTKLNISDTTSMLLPYLRRADTTNMLLPYFRDADTTLLNLTSRFEAKQNTLNGTGFVKASGTNITYDNSSYLRTGLADSTYLKLTGGTLTGTLNVSAAGVPLTVNSTNSNTYKFNLSSSEVINSYLGSNNIKLFSIADKNVNELFFIDTLGKISVNASGVPININSINNNFYKLSFSNTNSGVITSYLGSDASKSLSIANNSANEVAYISYLGDAAFNGNITEAGNNVLTNLDTVSLSNRIDAKYNSSGGTISGAVTLSTTSATPTTLLGKDGSNVVGTVTTLAQTGLMKAGSVTQNTSSVGIISVAHGLSYQPTQVIATLAQQNSYVVVCHSITASDLFFTVYDSVTGNPLNNISVGIFWLAIK
jgi:hypothetical protein